MWHCGCGCVAVAVHVCMCVALGVDGVLMRSRLCARPSMAGLVYTGAIHGAHVMGSDISAAAGLLPARCGATADRHRSGLPPPPVRPGASQHPQVCAVFVLPG